MAKLGVGGEPSLDCPYNLARLSSAEYFLEKVLFRDKPKPLKFLRTLNGPFPDRWLPQCFLPSHRCVRHPGSFTQTRLPNLSLQEIQWLPYKRGSTPAALRGHRRLLCSRVLEGHPLPTMLVQKHMRLRISAFLAFPTAHDVILTGSRVHKFPCAGCTSDGSREGAKPSVLLCSVS